VQLLHFGGKRNGAVSDLSWMTSQERNNSHFIVERSRDGQQFSNLSAAIPSKAVNGNSNERLSYGYTDATPYQGMNYYRLAQYDVNGQVHYSQVVSVYFGDDTHINVYPNPTQGDVTVRVRIAKPTEADIRILDATGRVVRMVKAMLQAGENEVGIDMQGVADGVYMLQVSNGKGLQYSQPIRKY
jgi:hypothetical protein